MSIIKKVINSTALLLIMFTMSACSTYPSRFKCGDTKGLGCTMLHEVDNKIDSGEIAEVYKTKKCYGGHCEVRDHDTMILKHKSKANKHEEQNGAILDDENNLYF